MKKEEKPKRRRIAAGAVALFTSASMMVGGIFHTPADLPEQTQILPPPIVLDEDDLDGDGKNKKPAPPSTQAPQEEQAPTTAAEPEVALPEEEKRGLRRWWSALSFRQRLLLIPLAALAGWGLFTLAAAFLPGIVGKLVAWLATLAALAAGFVATEKAIFPDIPVKKLLRTKKFAGLLGGLAVLGAADMLVPLVWSGYAKWELLIHGAGVLLIFGTAGLSFAGKTHREQPASAAQKEPEAVPEPEEEKEKPMTRQDILALADTVSRKRK